MRAVYSWSVVAAAIMIACAHDTSASYTFQNVVDSTISPGVFRPFPDDGAAVANGSAAFFGGNSSTRAIYTSSGGPAVKLVETNVATPIGTFRQVGVGSFPGSYVGLGEEYVAFHGVITPLGGPPNERGIFSNIGGVTQSVALLGDAVEGGTFTDFGDSPAMSGKHIAFIGRYGASRGVFVSNGGTRSTIAKSGDPAPTGVFVGFGKDEDAVSISNGRVAMLGVYSTGTGIFSGTGGPLTTIAKRGDAGPSGPLVTFEDPSISGQDVAFRATYGSKSGLFKGNGGPLTLVAEIGQSAPTGNFLTFGEPAIAGGRVAFQGYYLGHQLWQEGIFIGDGGAIKTVIKTGDPLFGGVLTALAFGRFGADQDGSGRLAFMYSLDNGVNGVAFATPIPEPATFAMAAIAIAAICRMRRIRTC